MIEERLLRFAAPELYRVMDEIFSLHHIHPFDVQAFAVRNEQGMEITLRFTSDFSQFVTTHISYQQAKSLDQKVTQFFEDAAVKCKSLLIGNYYKNIKL